VSGQTLTDIFFAHLSEHYIAFKHVTILTLCIALRDRMINECGEVDRMRISRGNWGRKKVKFSVCLTN
jgi:hypothetical protein